MLPYEQGHLDSFCGIYAIVNSAKLVNRNIRGEEAIKLFGKCMRQLEKNRSLGRVSTAGIDEGDLWGILKERVLINYSIKVERPFYRAKKISTDDYFRELRDYFEEGEKRSAIISLESEDFDHWTVVRSITKKQIMLFDSYFIKTVHIAKCAVHKTTKEKPYLLTPKMTYFLYGK